MQRENYLKKDRKSRATDKSGPGNKRNSLERWNRSPKERRNDRRGSVRMRELEWW